MPRKMATCAAYQDFGTVRSIANHHSRHWICLLLGSVSGRTDPEKARASCWDCGGTITARMDSFCCVQGGTILGTKDTCVPKNLEPDTGDPPSHCTPNPPIHQLFLSKKHRSKPQNIWPPTHFITGSGLTTRTWALANLQHTHYDNRQQRANLKPQQHPTQKELQESILMRLSSKSKTSWTLKPWIPHLLLSRNMKKSNQADDKI
jgi:hypothetical protein